MSDAQGEFGLTIRARRVVHVDDPHDVYIGRPSPYGNPFRIGRDGTRREVIARFRAYVPTPPGLLERIRRELRGKVLGCYCAPHPCHGDVLAEIANAPVTISGAQGDATSGNLCTTSSFGVFMSQQIKFATRINRARKGAGYALMFFNLDIGVTVGEEFRGLLTVRDFSLKKSQNGDFYFQGPSKPRLRDGQLQKGQDGKGIYDEIFSLFLVDGAGKDGGWGPSKDSFALRKRIIEQAVAAFETLQQEEQSAPASKGRGSAGKDDFASSTGASAGDLFGAKGDEDDDLPF